MSTLKKKLLEFAEPVKTKLKPVTDSTINSLVSFMADKAFKENVGLGYFENTEINQKKLSYIKMLIHKNILDWPTQALILDWMDQTLDEYEQLASAVKDRKSVV